MGNTVLRGISTALFVTVITLLAGMFWSAMGLGGLSASSFVDIGLVASCLIAGYRTGKESGQWILGGAAALGYVGLSVLLVALFLPVSRWGAIQILAEGGIIGVVAGGFGAGNSLEKGYSIRSNSWGEGYSRGGWNRPSRRSSSSWGGDGGNWDEDDGWEHEENGDRDPYRQDQCESKISWEENTVRDSVPEEASEWEEWMSPHRPKGQGKDRNTEIEDREYPETDRYFEGRSSEPIKYLGKEAKRKGTKAWWEEDAGSYKVL